MKDFKYIMDERIINGLVAEGELNGLDFDEITSLIDEVDRVVQRYVDNSLEAQAILDIKPERRLDG